MLKDAEKEAKMTKEIEGRWVEASCKPQKA